MLRNVVLPLAVFGAIGAVAFGTVGVAEAAAVGGSATLQSGINFDEPQGSQGIGGKEGDCVGVNIPATGSIQFVTGTVTVWTDSNCTGKSLKVTKDIANLNDLGFGKSKSVRIGPA